MPQLLSEYSAAWKLITLGVLLNYSLLALWTGRCRLWEARVFQPHLLWITGDHIKSYFPDAKQLDQRTRNEVPCCPRQLYYFNPFHKLIAVHINEVMKGAVTGGWGTYADSSWVERLDDWSIVSILSSEKSLFLSSREGSQSSSAKWSPPENYKKWVALANRTVVSAAE